MSLKHLKKCLTFCLCFKHCMYCCTAKGDWSPKPIIHESRNQQLTKNIQQQKSWETRFQHQNLPIVSLPKTKIPPPTQPQPEWLKQWTISKGWTTSDLRTRHLMSLGRRHQDPGPSTSHSYPIHTDTIYECSSEDSDSGSVPISLYSNPIYSSEPRKSDENYQKFIQEHHLNTNKLKPPNNKKHKTLDVLNTNQKRHVNEKNENFLERVSVNEYETRVKTEQYVIQHIRLRVMFSLRLVKKPSKKNRDFVDTSNRQVNTTHRISRIQNERTTNIFFNTRGRGLIYHQSTRGGLLNTAEFGGLGDGKMHENVVRGEIVNNIQDVNSGEVKRQEEVYQHVSSCSVGLSAMQRVENCRYGNFMNFCIYILCFVSNFECCGAFNEFYS